MPSKSEVRKAMDKVVYALCAVTSAFCTVLLLRGYLRSGMRLLLWSTICFFCLFLANVLTYIDLIIFPDIDLLAIRNVITLTGLSVLIHGMIQETV
jgi:hypothetical protein